jgi:hypothetical protein
VGPTGRLHADFFGDGLLIAYKNPLLRHLHTLVIRIEALGTFLPNESKATHNEDHPQRGKLGTPAKGTMETSLIRTIIDVGLDVDHTPRLGTEQKYR